MVSQVPRKAAKVGMSSFSEGRSSGKPARRKASTRLPRTSAMPRGSERLRGFKALKSMGWAALTSGGGRYLQAPQGLAVGRAENAALGNDGGDILGRGHVEGRVFDSYSVRGHLLAAMVSDFARRPLFDGYVVTTCSFEIDG